MTLEAFLEKLESVRMQGGGYIARCPAHDDREPSLGITENDTGIGVRCHAGCATSDVVDAMGLQLRDLFFESGTDYGEPEEVYDYVDENGNRLFQTVRFPGKNFRQRHLGLDNAWIWNLDEVRRVVYRLPEVLAAVGDGVSVYICEGEKDVETLRAAGKVATCNPMGAGKWRDEYNEFFVGAKVIIVQDRDEPGRAHAEKIKESLQGPAQSIFVVQARKGKDVSDHLAAGYAVDEMIQVRERVRRGVISANELAERALEDLTLTPEDIPGYAFLPETEILFRQGRLYAIGGYTGDGKTSLALQGARQICAKGTRVAYFSLEMPERDLRNVLLSHQGIPLSKLEQPWEIQQDELLRQVYEQGVAEISSWNLNIVFESGMSAEKVSEIVRDLECDVAIIDHVHRFAWGMERRKFEEEISALTNLALEQNITLIALCQLREPRLHGKDIEIYPMPTLQSFRETGVIGQDSSMALAVWRQRDQTGVKYTGQTEIIVLKNRHTTGRKDQAGTQVFVSYDPSRHLIVKAGSMDVVGEEW